MPLASSSPASQPSPHSPERQKSGPAQPAEQQKLKERVEALESQLKEANTKADHAVMEKDYIERIQKEAKDYYDKVLTAQTWTLGIVGLIITIVSAATARFGLTIFDRHIEQAAADLEAKFDQKLAQERAKLEESNAAQVKELNDALQTQISRLVDDLELRSSYSHDGVEGLALAAHENYPAALGMYRRALLSYKVGKARHLFDRSIGNSVLHDLFVTLERLYKANVVAEAKKELADELYNDLEEELALAALQLPWLAPLVKDRKPGAPVSPPSTQAVPSGTQTEKAHSGTAPAPPNKPTTK